MEKYNNFNIARFYSERKALDRRTVYNRFARKHNQEELAVARGGLEGFGDEFNMHFNPFAVSVLRLSFSFPQFLFFFVQRQQFCAQRKILFHFQCFTCTHRANSDGGETTDHSQSNALSDCFFFGCLSPSPCRSHPRTAQTMFSIHLLTVSLLFQCRFGLVAVNEQNDIFFLCSLCGSSTMKRWSFFRSGPAELVRRASENETFLCFWSFRWILSWTFFGYDFLCWK